MALDMQSSRGVARWIVLAVVVDRRRRRHGGVGRRGEGIDRRRADRRPHHPDRRPGRRHRHQGGRRGQPIRRAGTVLVEIDPKDYQVALAKAEAELADARADALAAGIERADCHGRRRPATCAPPRAVVDEAQAAIAVAERQLEAAQAQRTAAEARLRERRAAATKAERDVERLKPLVAKEEVAQQQYDAAVATADGLGPRSTPRSPMWRSRSATSPWPSSGRCRPSPPRPAPRPGCGRSQTGPEQMQVTRARASAAEARVKRAEAAVAQAQLALDRAVIKAPVAGIVGRKASRSGRSCRPASR